METHGLDTIENLTLRWTHRPDLIGLGIASSHATLPEPLLNQGTLPPEEADGSFRYWSRHEKYFLVIAVNQTDVPKTNLPFAQVDGQRVVNALTRLGYQPVDPAHPMLSRCCPSSKSRVLLYGFFCCRTPRSCNGTASSVSHKRIAAEG